MSVNRVVNVAINGYGVIGKRIAEAVSRDLHSGPDEFAGGCVEVDDSTVVA